MRLIKTLAPSMRLMVRIMTQSFRLKMRPDVMVPKYLLVTWSQLRQTFGLAEMQMSQSDIHGNCHGPHVCNWRERMLITHLIYREFPPSCPPGSNHNCKRAPKKKKIESNLLDAQCLLGLDALNLKYQFNCLIQCVYANF